MRCDRWWCTALARCAGGVELWKPCGTGVPFCRRVWDPDAAVGSDVLHGRSRHLSVRLLGSCVSTEPRRGGNLDEVVESMTGMAHTSVGRLRLCQ
jgi:hypothetical protein